MNKHFRKLLVLSMVIVMMFSMSAVAFADGITTGKDTNSNLTVPGKDSDEVEGTPDTSNVPVANNTDTIYLIKDYDRGAGTQTDSKSPAENFVFTIVPFGVWNAGNVGGIPSGEKYKTSNIPLLGDGAKDGTKVVVDGDSRETTVTISANAGDAEDETVDGYTIKTNLKQQITIPKYDTIGDFWYKVTEKNSNTTGVIYTTNDGTEDTPATANNAHGLTYYIHVQVLYDNTVNPAALVKTVTLHKNGPVKADGVTAVEGNDAYNTWVGTDYANYKKGDSIKVNDIQNEYYAGSLEIKKEVTGNAGDKTKRFEVTVTFTKPEGSIITSDITYKAAISATEDDAIEQTIMGQDDASSKWKEGETEVKSNTNNTNSLTNTVKIYIKDGETVTFNNIPYGVSYKVIETEPADDTYTNKIEYTSAKDDASKFDGKDCAADTVSDEVADKDFDENATGSITDKSDAIKITNTKNTAIDVGVILENAPYVALLLIAGAAVVIFARRKSVTEE